jgi:hypothetical protein
MSNMSYCRFNNTLSDLRDCFKALKNEEIESSEEKRKEKIMLEEIAEFLIDEDIIQAGDIHGEVIVNYDGIKEWIYGVNEEGE